MAALCIFSLLSSTWLEFWSIPIHSRAIRSPRVCPGLFSLAAKIQSIAIFVLCLSFNANGLDVALACDLCVMVFTAGEASNTACRRIGIGEFPLVKALRCSKISEALFSARARLPSFISREAKKLSRGSCGGATSILSSGTCFGFDNCFSSCGSCIPNRSYITASLAPSVACQEIERVRNQNERDIVERSDANIRESHTVTLV